MTPHMVDGMIYYSVYMGFQRYPVACFFVYGNFKVACAVGAVADVDCRVNLMPGESKTIADFMVGAIKHDRFP